MENWKEIWGRHSAILSGKEDFASLVLELKRANGFDVTGDDGVGFDAWIRHIRVLLQQMEGIESLYEVGCGSGANLLMAQYSGVSKVGGCDYSDSLARAAKEITGSRDIVCCDAEVFPESPLYDAVILDSVSQYFPSLHYAESVLKRMVGKAGKYLAVLDIFDAALKTEWIEHRRAVIPGYDQRYGRLDQDKLFIHKDWLRSFSRENGLEVTLYGTDIEGYWNGNYTFNALFRKNGL